MVVGPGGWSIHVAPSLSSSAVEGLPVYGDRWGYRPASTIAGNFEKRGNKRNIFQKETFLGATKKGLSYF